MPDIHSLIRDYHATQRRATRSPFAERKQLFREAEQRLSEGLSLVGGAIVVDDMEYLAVDGEVLTMELVGT